MQMATTVAPDARELHVLPEAEIERLELLALASAALIAHAEKLMESEQLTERDRRAD
jgi:GAF domain-containing protein